MLLPEGREGKEREKEGRIMIQYDAEDRYLRIRLFYR